MSDNAPGILVRCEHCNVNNGFHIQTHTSNNQIIIECDDCGNVDVWEA